MVLKHEAEDGICGRFRRRHSPCPSEASNLAPSLVSPPPPWVWPKVKATITDMRKKTPQPQVQMQTVHFVSEKVVQPLSEWTSRWAAVPCHFWLPWSGQRWHRLRRSTAHWGAAARREPARPGHNSLSTPAGAPQLGSCGSIWGNMPKVAVKEGETCPFPLRGMLQLGKRQYVRGTVKCAHCWLL